MSSGFPGFKIKMVEMYHVVVGSVLTLEMSDIPLGYCFVHSDKQNTRSEARVECARIQKRLKHSMLLY